MGFSVSNTGLMAVVMKIVLQMMADQRFAKKARKWDYYAQEKMKLIQKIEEYENHTITE